MRGLPSRVRVSGKEATKSSFRFYTQRSLTKERSQRYGTLGSDPPRLFAMNALSSHGNGHQRIQNTLRILVDEAEIALALRNHAWPDDPGHGRIDWLERFLLRRLPWYLHPPLECLET